MIVTISKHNGFRMVCDFCATPESEAELLILSPNGTHICAECVEVCQAVISERRKPKPRDMGEQTQL